MLNCPICRKEMNYINNAHLKSHNLTPSKFKELYPNLDYVDKSIIDKMSNNKNCGALKNKELSCLYQKNYYENPKKCIQCSSVISYEKRRNKFCSSSCSASFSNKNRVVKYSVEGLKSLLESALINFKKTKRNKGVFKEYINTCNYCSKIFSTTYKNKNNKNCSKKCKDSWHSLNNFRQNKTLGKCGYYKGIYCGSSWELAFLVYNLDLRKDIKRCDLKFRYKIGEKEHFYFPDFLMNEKIYEVKGRESEDVALKTKAVIDDGYEIEIVRKKEIMPIINLLKKKYNVKDIVELYDKKI